MVLSCIVYFWILSRGEVAERSENCIGFQKAPFSTVFSLGENKSKISPPSFFSILFSVQAASSICE